jgi:hypothetical protein
MPDFDLGLKFHFCWFRERVNAVMQKDNSQSLKLQDICPIFPSKYKEINSYYLSKRKKEEMIMTLVIVRLGSNDLWSL